MQKKKYVACCVFALEIRFWLPSSTKFPIVQYIKNRLKTAQTVEPKYGKDNH